MLRRRLQLADERGTTLVELVVGVALGMVVLSALTMLMITSMHASARVTARVHATQNARISLTKIIEQLHSACVVPKIAPVQAGSTGTLLSFSHAPASEGASATVKPVLSKVALSGTNLVETEYASLGGIPPTFSATAMGPPQILVTGVTPTPPSSSIFTYYTYSNGKLIAAPQKELGATEANSVIQVKVAFTGFPPKTSSSDSNVGASVENSVMLRLTPPSFEAAAGSLPCQ
jgi:Tfp pilus assembly protein PilW